VPDPSAETLLNDINPDSLQVYNGFVEPAIVAHEDVRFQFERQGYFCKDPELPGVFNKTVSLREGF
jgi:glutaminyl-tRNA synthetase